MFLYLGDKMSVPIKEIIGIFDLEATTTTKDTRDFLNVSEEEGFVVTVSDEMPKSFIVTERNKKSIIYISPISAATLRKRLEIWNGFVQITRKKERL